MYLQRILSPGLMAYSYIIGAEGKAVVVDPRRDYGIYMEEAAKAGLSILWALETHRHEDQISGAKGLALACGGRAAYSRYEDLGQSFGTPIGEEELISLGESLKIRPLHTPGHTLGHLSYVVEYEGRPLYVLTGDTLFFGGVGRTDFYGAEQVGKMTTLLHQSIYQKLASLGESVIVLPGHAAGSACGNDLDELPDSTLGRELHQSKALSPDLERFLALHARMYFKNPAFSKMEWVNVEGSGDAVPPPLKICTDLAEDGRVLDIRDRLAFSAAHLPDSLLAPAELCASYVGWQIASDEALTLLADGLSREQIELAWATLYRSGFDGLRGVLPNGYLRSAAISGQTLARTALISARDYLALKPSAGDCTLDVRLPEEYLPGRDRLFNRINIPLQALKARLAEVPAEGRIYLLCGSGERATVAAALLSEPERVQVISGGIHALRALDRAAQA